MQASETTASREPIYQYRFKSDDEWTGWFDCNEKQYEEVVRYGYERRIIKVEPAPQAQPESVDAELLAALKWAAMFYPRDGEDSNEKFERIGSVFHAETGYLRPGKDSVLHSFVEQERAWATWIKDKQKSMRLAIQRAESAKQSAPRQIVTATLPGSPRPTHRGIEKEA